MHWNKILPGMMVVIIVTGLLQYDFTTATTRSADHEEPIRLLATDQGGATFELVTPEYQLEELDTIDGTFQSLRVDGYGLMDQPGQPELPTTSVMLGIPADGKVTITIVSDDVVNIPGVNNLSPAPVQISASDDANKLQLNYSANQEAYQQDNFYPETPVKVEDYGWLRDQRFVQIRLYPFQYNPAEGVILWHQRLIVQVHFEQDEFQSGANSGRIDILENDNSFETLLMDQILNYDTALAWRTTPPVEADHQTSVSGDRLRIVVDQDGLYRISYTDLITAGMEGTDPRTYQMTNQGLNVAIEVVGESDGTLDEGDFILFYGEAYDGDTMAAWYTDESQNWITYTQQLTDGTTTLWHPEFTGAMMEKYNNKNVYWLQSLSEGTPTRMQIVSGIPGDAPIPDYYHATTHSEIQWERWEFHYTSEDTWFTQWVRDTTTRSFYTNLSALYTEPFTAVVRSEYVGYTFNNLLTPDHHTVFRLNSRVDPINESYWDGRSRHSFEATIPSTDLVEGTNTLYFNIVEDDLVPVTSWIFFDWFEIDYLRRFVAAEDALAFPGENTGTWRHKLEGFTTADILVYDVTDPHLPNKINNVITYFDGTYHAEFQYTYEAGARFYAVSGNAIRSPITITRYVPPDLRSTTNGADYLIIAHADFLAAAQTLADYRAGQGLRVRIVDVQDLYNEFNEGILHPVAIKNFLEYTFAMWTPPAPLYVVLVGDGHWDILESGYTNASVYLPPNLGWVDPIQGEVDSSNLLATIAGDDPLPDVYIGRIPVNTPQEFQNVINKIIAFEQVQNQEWQLNNTFIADNTPDAVGNFPAVAEYIISEYIEPGFTPIRIYEDNYGCSPTNPSACPAVTAEILETINMTGTMFMTYIGHASVQNWSHERIFVIANIASLTNSTQLPVVLSMDCLDGYWFHPITQPSMAEVFLRTANYGAAATFSPTGLGVGLGHYTLMEGFFSAVYRDGLWEMGAATLGAKLALYNAGYFRDMLHTYTTFGDPALRFPSPYDLSVHPTEAAQQALPGTRLTYPIQVSNTGTLTDIIAITLEGNIWQTALSANLFSLDAGETVEVLVTVDIPADVLGGLTDVALIRVRSEGDAAELKSVTLNSTALVRIRLPMMRK